MDPPTVDLLGLVAGELLLFDQPTGQGCAVAGPLLGCQALLEGGDLLCRHQAAGRQVIDETLQRKGPPPLGLLGRFGPGRLSMLGFRRQLGIDPLQDLP